MKLGIMKGLVRKYKEIPNEDILYKEELNVILAVLFKVLDSNVPRKGTFLLVGQRYTENMQKLVEFNFKEGKQRNFLGQDRDSDIQASTILWDASCYSSEPCSDAIKHLFNTPYIMSLETLYGRFLAAFFADYGDFRLQEKAYLTIVKTITMLNPEDEVLQNSCSKTFWARAKDHSDGESRLEEYIEFLFKTKDLPEIKKWSEWKRANETKRGIKLFFE